MKPPNFYEIVYEWMIISAFKDSALLKYLKEDVDRSDDIQVSRSWGNLKQSYLWYAKIVADVEYFLDENFDEAGLGLGNTYEIFPHLKSSKPPRYRQDCRADFMLIIEFEDGEDEVKYTSVDSLLEVEFSPNGNLKSIELEEELTGSRFQIWPELEYSADEPIYIDEKLAAAEGFL